MKRIAKTWKIVYSKVITVDCSISDKGAWVMKKMNEIICWDDEKDDEDGDDNGWGGAPSR